MSEFHTYNPDQSLSPAIVARQFLEIQYDQTEGFSKGLTDLPIVEFDDLISHPFMFEFPDTGQRRERATEIIIADFDDNGTPLGFGEISYVTGIENPIIKNKPYVAYTETLEAGSHRGLNIRRLKVMNKLALQYFGFALHSDHSGDTEPQARASWDRLVKQGVAEQYIDSGMPRYRFKTKFT